MVIITILIHEIVFRLSQYEIIKIMRIKNKIFRWADLKLKQAEAVLIIKTLKTKTLMGKMLHYVVLGLNWHLPSIKYDHFNIYQLNLVHAWFWYSVINMTSKSIRLLIGINNLGNYILDFNNKKKPTVNRYSQYYYLIMCKLPSGILLCCKYNFIFYLLIWGLGLLWLFIHLLTDILFVYYL